MSSSEGPVRIQLKRTKGWRMPPDTVKVTRPGPWGNYAGATRADFERDLNAMSNADKAFYLDKVKELRGKNLACWCKIGSPCHADVLLEIANSDQTSLLSSSDTEVGDT